MVTKSEVNCVKNTAKQRWFSIAILGLAFLFGIWFYTKQANFIWYWIFGLGFGFLLQRFRICFLSAVSEPMITNSTERFRSILIGILVSSLGITCIKYLSNGALDMLGVSSISLPLILGGFLFGMGMILAGCCTSGIFVRFAEGYVIHIYTLICTIAGYLIANNHYEQVWAPFVAKSPIVFLPEKLGWAIGVSLHLFIILILYLVACKHEKNLSPSYSTLYLTGAVLFGVLNILHYIVLNSGLSITGGFSWFINQSGVTVAHNIRNLGLFVGALFSALLRCEFRLQKIRSYKQVFTAIAGGLFMGYGAGIAGGCNINAFFNAAASLSLSGWIFMIFLFAGTYIGMRFLYKLMQ